MNKKFKNKFAVTGSKHLLKAFAEELKEIGYISEGIINHGIYPLIVNEGVEYDNGAFTSWPNSLNSIPTYKLDKEWNKALELAKEVEEVIPEYVKIRSDIATFASTTSRWSKDEPNKVYKVIDFKKSPTKDFKCYYVGESICLIPDDVIPATKEEYVIQQIPEYVKCLESYFDQYTKGKIYKNDLKKSSVNQYVTLEDDLGSQNGWNPDMFTPSTKEEYEAQFKLYFGDKEVRIHKKSTGFKESVINVECAGEVGTLEQVQAIVDYVEFNKNKSFKFGSKDIAISHSQTRVSMSKPLKFTDEELKFIIGCQTGTLAQAKKILEAGNKLK
jgi:hypothetical protein